MGANPGYSCCWSPEDLRSYFEVHACGAPGDHHGEVIVFEGEHVGQGDDGEPLAIPTRVVDRLPWSGVRSQYDLRGGGRTIAPEIPRSGSRRSPQPLRPATKPKNGSPTLSPSGRKSCSPCTPSTDCRSVSIAALLAAAQMPITPAGVQKLMEKARKER